MDPLEPKSGTATAALAALRENERRFLAEIRKIEEYLNRAREDYPAYLCVTGFMYRLCLEQQCLYCEAMRPWPLVRLRDTPMFVMLIQLRMYNINYEYMNLDILNFLLRHGPVTFTASVYFHESRGIYGSRPSS